MTKFKSSIVRKLPVIILFLSIALLSSKTIAQANRQALYATPDTITTTDTIVTSETYWLTPEETLITTDTIIEAQTGFITDSATITEKWKPDSEKTMWWGAIIPGMGQIINRKYWKLPIVYAGFMGCTFAITFTSERYNTYRIAWRDIVDKDPDTDSFLPLLPAGTEYNESQNSYWATQLKNRQDQFRRYRDLSIVITVIYYGLTILEAYVDAQLYDFDISPDLSMRVQPTIMNNDLCIMNQYNYSPQSVTKIGKENAIGVQFCFTLK